MFEVQDLRFATLATVSRCGMVWFSEDVLSMDMVFENFLSKLRNIPIDEGEEEARQRLGARDTSSTQSDTVSPSMQVHIILFLYNAHPTLISLICMSSVLTFYLMPMYFCSLLII